MKKIFFVFLFTATFGFSQSGFIEVEVRDTIRLNPSKICYNITINRSDLYQPEAGKTYDPVEAKNKTNSKLDEIKKFLESYNYTFNKIGESNYQINNSLSSWKNGFVVTASNVKELEKLSRGLKQFDFIDATISKVDRIENSYSDERLFEKLINKAKLKAKTIAQISNLNVGKIIEVKEVKEIDNMNFSVLDMIITSKGSSSFDDTTKFYGVRSKALIVKFLAE